MNKHNKRAIAQQVMVAIIQQPSVVLNLQASLHLAVDYIAEAAMKGAQLIAFPETWLTCYPAWVFGLAGWDDANAQHWYARLLAESPVIDDTLGINDDLFLLREAAKKHSVTVVMGINERAGRASGTLYNSLITIGIQGLTLNLHRKLTPTHTEKIIWAAGDAAGLKVVDTEVGKVGGLICWEHWLPLARQSLHAQDEQIHVAAWPDLPEMHHIASRAYAFEGRCFVICAGQFLTTDDIPSELLSAYRAGVGPNAPEHGILFGGGSGIIGPDGVWLAEPMTGQAGIIIITIDLSKRNCLQQNLDVAGHYARPDVFELTINRRRGNGIIFKD